MSVPYLILRSGVTGSCDWSFGTRSEADAAAIQVANPMIKSRRCGEVDGVSPMESGAAGVCGARAPV